MSIRVVKWIIAVITFSVFIFVLWNYATIAQFPTELRDFPAEVSSSLSRGDTREKVYSVLGEPLVDASKLDLQVYQHSASDITFDIALPFIPFWTPDVYVFSLVTYSDKRFLKTTLTIIARRIRNRVMVQAAHQSCGYSPKCCLDKAGN